MRARLKLTRAQVLAFRRRVGALDERLPAGAASLRRAAWAGLQDSVPRAALLSLHARVAGTGPASWEHRSLVQVWGPRFSTYVVPARDRAIFTNGRMSVDASRRAMAQDLANRLEAFLAGRRMTDTEAGRGLGEDPSRLRFATTTGRVLIRWDGARAPTIWMVPPPAVDPDEAKRELARRYLHVFGPGTASGFSDWAGVKPGPANAVFAALETSLTPVRTPIGDAWVLSRDEANVRAGDGPAAAARLLPSGDAYYLLQGVERALLIPDAQQRSRLWTSRVWPGALMVRGEVVGTWRRSGADLRIEPWRRLSRADRDAVTAEAAALPLPGLDEALAVHWDETA